LFIIPTRIKISARIQFPKSTKLHFMTPVIASGDDKQFIFFIGPLISNSDILFVDFVDLNRTLLSFLGP
jgi:hypothetical protein